MKALADAVGGVGLFAVLDEDQPSPSALAQFAACAASGDIPASELNHVTMEDGAIRSTLATRTVAGQPAAIPKAVLAACPPSFTAAVRSLRQRVAATGLAYARVLDQLVYGGRGGSSGSSQQATTTAAPTTNSFETAVREAESLEHLHVFSRPTSTSSSGSGTNDRMLDLHSDIGLFLVMTAAEYVQLGSNGGQGSSMSSARRLASSGSDAAAPPPAGLLLQLADGRMVRPIVPPGSLLVMNGEGAARWMAPPVTPGGVRPFPAAHAVESVPLGGSRGMVRAWFGRMFFPLASARLQQDATASQDGSSSQQQGAGDRSAMTWGQYRAQTYAAFRTGAVAAEGGGGELSSSLAAVGCAPTRQLLADEGSCGADQVCGGMIKKCA